LISLELPLFENRDTYEACISRVRNPAIKHRMALATPAIHAAANEYAILARNQALHQLVAHDQIAGVTRSEMETTYNSRMVKAGSPGRDIYDAIMAAPHDGRCPYCGQRVVSTLDHVLPKSLYPAYAVAPVNLVPSCSDCNKLKLDDDPATAVEVYLHPYFDDVEQCVWLAAQVVERSPAALVYSVVPCVEWDATQQERLLRQFQRLHLGRLYALESANELTAIRYSLEMIFEAGGAEQVEGFLREQEVSARHARRNWWRASAYLAWADSNWFCEGGFR